MKVVCRVAPLQPRYGSTYNSTYQISDNSTRLPIQMVVLNWLSLSFDLFGHVKGPLPSGVAPATLTQRQLY